MNRKHLSLTQGEQQQREEEEHPRPQHDGNILTMCTARIDNSITASHYKSEHYRLNGQSFLFEEC